MNAVTDLPRQEGAENVPLLGSGRPSVPPGDAARLRPVALAALTLALIGLCVLLSVPFLPALAWGAALAVIASPLHAWLARRVRWPEAAAGAAAAIVVVVILVPGVFVAYQLAREAGSAADQMEGEAAGSVLRKKMEDLPVLNRVVAWMDRVGFDVEREVRDVVTEYTQDASGLLRGSVGTIIQLLVAVFVLYYFFRDRAALLQGVRALLPMSRADSDRVFAHVADSVHASLYATLVTAAISAGTGGFMFWLLGLPSPVLWGVVMFVLSVLPIVGTALVWVPAAAYLVLTGRWPEALGLTAWGLTCFVVVDTLLYTRLAGNGMRLHQVPVLIAFLGGLAVFGVSGIVLGPAILAVTVALLEVWKRPTREALTAPPAGGAAAGP